MAGNRGPRTGTLIITANDRRRAGLQGPPAYLQARREQRVGDALEPRPEPAGAAALRELITATIRLSR